MITRTTANVAIALALVTAVTSVARASLGAQTLPRDSVLRLLYDEGMTRSQTSRLAQVLTDSLGPRLTGSPGMRRAQDWLKRQYAAWGISARDEQYGTWKGWRRGLSHLELITPRVRTLEATMLAWSPGTNGAPVTAPVVTLPDIADSAAFQAWLPTVAGKFVALSFPEPTCRPDATWERFATPEAVTRMKDERTAARAAWAKRITNTGYTDRTLPTVLENAGAVGVLTSTWSAGYGVNKIFRARTTRVPTFDVGCEDYGLLARLAEQGQSPVVRMDADATDEGDVPVFNVIAELRGTEKPEEYVMLSAHFDSWDGSSGATDNGTGTVAAMEAMRLLRMVYPKPKRTILVGHWSGEEEGLIGSGAFATDHPEIVRGLHALFNQDNGTGRLVRINLQGLTQAGTHIRDYVSALPASFTRELELVDPGEPSRGGSDFVSFSCRSAPGFSLQSLDWEYGIYTWHTNRDTYDKIVFDELKQTATTMAMLAYLASEDPTPIPHERRAPKVDAQGKAQPWPACPPVPRSWAEWTR